MGGGNSASSSGEEDGDADWRAAIDSVAAAGLTVSVSNGPTKPHQVSNDSLTGDKPYKEQNAENPKILKLYQIKAQKLLDDLLSKNLEIVTKTVPPLDENHQENEGGIRLFRKAPPGMTLDPIDPHLGPQKRPRILPGEDIDERSKKFKHQLRSVIVDDAVIMDAAREACQRSLSRFEARVSAAKEAAKREEERVAKLKIIRGEKWLPSIAREKK